MIFRKGGAIGFRMAPAAPPVVVLWRWESAAAHGFEEIRLAMFGLPRVGDEVIAGDMCGIVEEICWRVDDDGELTPYVFLGDEDPPEPRSQARPAPSAPDAVVSRSVTTSVKHRVEVGDAVGYVHEYASGTCWARVDDDKLGSFPDLDAAIVAVKERLSR